MESSNLNSINDVETDRASLHLPTQEITCDEERHFAGAKQEYPISYPPAFTAPNLTSINVSQTTGFVLFQCSRNRQNYESGSDSAGEEHSPYSSTEKLKYEAIAPTGNQQEKCTLRTKPSNPPDDNNVALNQHMRSQYPHMNVSHHKPGLATKEIGNNEGKEFEALVLTGSLREKSTYREMPRPDLKPHGEIENPFNDNVSNRTVADGSEIPGPRNIKYEDVTIRLATFFEHAIDWPHSRPSPEQMARAGMIYKGVFSIKGEEVCDMVECYKCGKTLYGFQEKDDPVVEHKKFYPDCQ